jgi:hypothetical protein
LGRPVRTGRERLRQVLHERGISFQRTRTWKESTDPDPDAKLDRIEYLTSAYPDRCCAAQRRERTRTRTRTRTRSERQPRRFPPKPKAA